MLVYKEHVISILVDILVDILADILVDILDESRKSRKIC